MRPRFDVSPPHTPAMSRITRRRAGATSRSITMLVLAGFLIAGCLELEDDPAPFESMCEEDSDCDGGEYCDDDICWGNPPDTHFAALLLPPDNSGALAATEIPRVEIDADGDVLNLAFAPSVTVSGRVALACDPALPVPGCVDPVAIEALIQITRPSIIPGRTSYIRSEVSRAADAGGEPSFSIQLPVSDEPYEITVVPSTSASNGAIAGFTPSELAPPITFSLDVTSESSLGDEVWLLGEPENYLVVEGEVVDSLGGGLLGMKVEAQLPDRSSRRVSSLGFTDAVGHFTLRVPRGLEGTVDIVAVPTTGTSAPTLRLRDVVLSELVPLEPLLLQMPTYGEPTPYVLPIQGPDGSGGTAPVRGATVRAVTELSEPDASLVALYTAAATTDEIGQARLMLIPGSQIENRDYMISVLPPNTSEHSTLFDQIIGIGRGSNLPPISLGRRVSVSGSIREANGREADGAAVEVRLSGDFLDPLSPDVRVLASTISLPQATSIPNGRFQVWLDETRLGLSVRYDLDVRSGSIIGAPLTIYDVDISQREAGSNSFEFGDIQLPDASYARGLVTAPDGTIVPEARVRLFEVAPGCVIEDPEFECTPPRDLGLQSGDEDGEVMLILPRPGPATTNAPPVLESVE